MGFLDGIKKSWEEKKERERHLEEDKYEFMDLLEEFTIDDMEDFLDKYLNEIPADPQTCPRPEWERFILKHWEKGDIKYKHLKNFALKQKIVTQSRFEEDASDDFQIITRAIQEKFDPEKIRDEDGLQAQLAIFLKAKFPDKRIDREVKTKDGDYLDIVIDGKYVFELKVPEQKTSLRNLQAQLEEYQETYPDICAIILDIGKDGMAQHITYYTDRYMRILGIPTIVLQGRKSASQE